MESQKELILSGLAQVKPFSELSNDGKELLKSGISWRKYEIGDRIYREDEMPDKVLFIVAGEGRLLGRSFRDNTLITLKKVGVGSLLGWAGLLRGQACETIQSSQDIEAISIPSEIFVRLILTEEAFRDYFKIKTNLQ